MSDAGLAAATTSEAMYAALRKAGPVRYDHWFGGWVVTRHADMLAALREPALRADDPLARLERFCERGGPRLENFRKIVSTISFYIDEPRHDGIRRFLAQVFQGIDIDDLRARLETRAAVLIEAGRAAGNIDLASEYARDLALFTIHMILGIAFDECVRLAALARDVAGFFDFVPRSPRQFARADRRLGELLGHFERLIVNRRRVKQADRISFMIDLARQNLDIGDAELAGFCAFFFVAGEETTATGIAASSVLLLERPDIREMLAAHPGRIPDAVREFLRLSSPFQYVTRIAAADVCVGGQRMARGDTVHLILAAANRDPQAFADPDQFDIDRGGPEAIPFGHGAYRCLGARMATLEMEVAVSVLSRQPGLRLGPVTWEARTRVPALAAAPACFVRLPGL